jgi:hypothetical protein
MDISFFSLCRTSTKRTMKCFVLCYGVFGNKEIIKCGIMLFVKRCVTELVCYSQVGGMRNMPVPTVLSGICSRPRPPYRGHWSGPSLGLYKCNIDASFSVQRNKVGTGMCIRDDQCRFVLAKTEWMTSCIDVDLGEALGLLNALKWVNDLQLSPTE